MVVPPIVGLLIGRYLDNRFDTNPIFTIVFLVFGFAASVREVANVLKRANSESSKKQDDDSGETK
jgi:F0F1-type ATP synthase assembly protein I